MYMLQLYVLSTSVSTGAELGLFSERLWCSPVYEPVTSLSDVASNRNWVIRSSIVLRRSHGWNVRLLMELTLINSSRWRSTQLIYVPSKNSGAHVIVEFERNSLRPVQSQLSDADVAFLHSGFTISISAVSKTMSSSNNWINYRNDRMGMLAIYSSVCTFCLDHGRHCW